MGEVQPMVSEPSGDWYEVIISAQPEGVGLDEQHRETFNDAFDSFTNCSYEAAHNSFSELADQGSSVCQYYLGVMYSSGMGVLQDFCKAHMWLNIASSQGHKKARKHLDTLTHNMTADQIAEAQKRARKWVMKHARNTNDQSNHKDETETGVS